MPRYVVTARIVLAVKRHVAAESEEAAQEQTERLCHAAYGIVDAVEEVEVTSVTNWETISNED